MFAREPSFSGNRYAADVSLAITLGPKPFLFYAHYRDWLKNNKPYENQITRLSMYKISNVRNPFWKTK